MTSPQGSDGSTDSVASRVHVRVQVNERLTGQVAHLARLELSEDEIRIYTAQLEKILGYVQSLQAVNVAGVEPLISPADQATNQSGTLLREDVLRPSAADVLDSAPDVLDNGYKVPPIL